MKYSVSTKLTRTTRHSLVVDTSILIALLWQEPGWEQKYSIILQTSWVCISAASYVECCIVMQRSTSAQAAPEELDVLLTELRINVVPVNEQQARVAAEAYERFGKGRHPAALNFGDCFSYALAKHRNEPLLFKGEDFRQTDVLVA